MKKKLYLMLCAVFAMFILWGGTDARAVEAKAKNETIYAEETYINPVYEDVVTEDDLLKPDNSQDVGG